MSGFGYYYHELKYIAAFVVISLACSFASAEFDIVAKMSEKIPIHLFTLLFSCLIPVILSIVTIRKAFTRETYATSQQLLKVIICSYFAIVLAFAGAYYSLTAIGDYRDALAAKEYYTTQMADSFENPSLGVLPRLKRERAFSGIDARTWSFIDREPPPYVVWSPEALRSDRLSGPYSGGNKQIIRSGIGERQKVFVDCLHFSVITMASLGYGDIYPKTLYAKLATDLQVVASVLIIVFGLGSIFSRWRGSTNH